MSIGVATPAALLAIASGMWVFVHSGLVAPWLAFKLGVVALLVLAHGLCGLLVLRVEDAQHRATASWCRSLQAALKVLLLTIAWLALRNPS